MRDRVNLEAVEIGVAWSVRGDPRRAAFVVEAEHTIGLALPVGPGATTRSAQDGEDAVLGSVLLSLGPTTWLFVASPNASPPAFDPARKALNAARGALFDVSASYVAWSIIGNDAARVLNCACPLDLDQRAFPVGHCAQSLLGHVGALLYRPAASTFIVMVARSFAADVKRNVQAFVDQTSTITHVGA
ncbi:MAG TPA: hypothetical protein VLI21_02635 [Casimicrobiaceae bacterium]|nr:hypothetical protein [Casimicrobiaceae bacterium]